jgi:esterase/lipase superfamily enzyme
MPVALNLFTDKSIHSFDETHSFLAARCDLTTEKIERELSSKSRANWISRVTRTWNSLKGFGLTRSVRHENAQITDFGLLVADDSPPQITPRYLAKFPQFSTSEYAVTREARRDALMGDASTAAPREPPVPRKTDEALLRDPRDVLVWFGTNRKPKNFANIEEGFTTARDTRTHLGRVTVNIPEGHSVGGPKGGILRRWFKGTRGLVLRSIESLSKADFWSSLRAAIEPNVEENSMLFFLHGFRQTFEEAAIRTAQLKYDLKIPHAAFYSWPSKAHLAGYIADSTSVEAAAPNIAEFLSGLGGLMASQDLKLHIVAHSMGNRALLLALEKLLISLRGKKPKFTFSDIVFAAADVDQQIFVNSVALTSAFSQRRTLYASAVDRALQGSGYAHQMIRAGRLPPVTIAKQTDTIDVPNFDFNILGHGYYASARPVLHDMFDLMHYGTWVANRQGIQPQSDKAGAYWRLM